MKGMRVVCAVSLALSALCSATWADEMGVVKQEAQTTHYRFALQIGPKEPMYSKAEAAKTHPTSGEVMVSGRMTEMTMPMASGMAMDERHLEVSVTSRATGKTVTNARVRITVTDDSTKKAVAVPVAAMYGVKEGPSDWHYGNNVSMPPGTYTVEVVVNGERGTFHVTIPKM